MAGLGFAGFVSFLAVTFQGAQSDAGRNGLVVAASVSLVLGVVGAIGWMATRQAPHPREVVRQDVRQRGASPRNAQQTARDNRGVMVQGDYHEHGVEEKATPRTNQWFVRNDDESRGVEARGGNIESEMFVWWRLVGWMCFRTTNLPSLTIRALCKEHRVEFLVNVKGTESYEPQEGVSTNSDSRVLQCPLDQSVYFLWEDWGTTRSRGVVLMDRAARDGGWRSPPENDDPDRV